MTQAIAKYREDNDWLGHFIVERCDVGEEYRERSGDLYAAYRAYCSNTGAFTAAQRISTRHWNSPGSASTRSALATMWMVSN